MVGSYVVAEVRGFSTSTLRCLVTRVSGSQVFVLTADIADVGTPIVVDADKVRPMSDEAAMVHKHGLVNLLG